MMELNKIELNKIELNKAKQHDELLTSKEIDKGDLFFRVFNSTYLRMFLGPITCMRDYNTPILPLSSFDNFVEKAKETFPRLWTHLSALRNVKENQNNYGVGRVLPQEQRQ